MHLELHPSEPGEMSGRIVAAVVVTDDAYGLDAYCPNRPPGLTRLVDTALRDVVLDMIRGTVSAYA